MPEKPTDADHVSRAPNERSPPSVEQLSVNGSCEDNIRVKMIGAVGNDRYREKFILELNKNGVDMWQIRWACTTALQLCYDGSLALVELEVVVLSYRSSLIQCDPPGYWSNSTIYAPGHSPPDVTGH
jgi:hypothetical protein